MKSFKEARCIARPVGGNAPLNHGHEFQQVRYDVYGSVKPISFSVEFYCKHCLIIVDMKGNVTGEPST